MAIQPMALGLRPVEINAVDDFARGAANASNLLTADSNRQTAELDRARQGLETIGSMALGVMGGDIEGQPDPALFEQGLDFLEGNGIDVASYRGRADMAPLLARSSMTALQQIQTAQNQQQIDLAMQKFEHDVTAAMNAPIPAPETETIYDSETGREIKVQWDGEAGGWVPIGGVKAGEGQVRTLTSAEAEELGLDPAKVYQVEPDGTLNEVGGSLVTVNTGDQGPRVGTIPPSMALVEDTDPNNPTGLRMETIPGSPGEREAQEAAAQGESQASTSATQAANTLQNVNAVRDIMQNASGPTTGTNSIPFAWHSGTDAGRIRSYVSTLQSGVALGAMQRLKEASATGATGFGSLSAPELNLLISELGALNPDTTEPEIFLQTLDRIETNARLVVEDIKRNVSPERIQELGLQPFIDAFGAEPEDQPNTTSAIAQRFEADPSRWQAETAPDDWTGPKEYWDIYTPEERASWP